MALSEVPINFPLRINNFVVLRIGVHFYFAVELGTDGRVSAIDFEDGVVLLPVHGDKVVQGVVGVLLESLGLLHFPLDLARG